MTMEYITYWQGKPIDEMSREELIIALKRAGQLYQEALDRNISQAQTFRQIAAARASREDTSFFGRLFR